MASPPMINVTSTRDTFDPVLVPERYVSVRRRRTLAFLIDFAIVLAINALLWIVLVVATLGLALLVIGSLFPVVAVLYWAFGISGRNNATLGMRACGIEMRMWYGDTVPFIVAVAHVLGFYVSMTLLTPFVLLVSLFDPRKRLLHDIVLGTLVMNDVRQAAALRR
jgi:uncharacterized RDD family membrane protein YckC